MKIKSFFETRPKKEIGVKLRPVVPFSCDGTRVPPLVERNHPVSNHVVGESVVTSVLYKVYICNKSGSDRPGKIVVLLVLSKRGEQYTSIRRSHSIAGLIKNQNR